MFWSLGVEFQWYIVAPLLITLIANRKSAVGLITIGLLVAGSIIFRNCCAYAFVLKKIDMNELLRLGNDQVYVHLYSFGLGVLLFRLRESSVSIPRIIIPGLWAYLIIAGVFSNYWFGSIDPGKPTGLFALINFIYLSQFVLAVMLFHYRNMEIGSRLLSKGIYAVSLVSYGLYIWHFPVLRLINSFDVPVAVKLICFINLSLMAAAASYFILEKNILRLKTI